MFWRKILFLAAWYVAGNLISSVYNGSKVTWKSAKVKTDPKSLVDKFITTQKNFIADMEKRYVSDENKEKLEEKKKQFLEASEKYIEQGRKVLTEVQENEVYSKSKNKLSELIETWYGVVKNSIPKSTSKNTKTSKSSKNKI